MELRIASKREIAQFATRYPRLDEQVEEAVAAIRADAVPDAGALVSLVDQDGKFRFARVDYSGDIATVTPLYAVHGIDVSFTDVDPYDALMGISGSRFIGVRHPNVVLYREDATFEDLARYGRFATPTNQSGVPGDRYFLLFTRAAAVTDAVRHPFQSYPTILYPIDQDGMALYKAVDKEDIRVMIYLPDGIGPQERGAREEWYTERLDLPFTLVKDTKAPMLDSFRI